MSLVDGVLDMVATFHPELGPLIKLAIQYEPEAEKIIPILQAAAKEGPGAFAAAEEHAPDLAEAIKNFVHAMPNAATSTDHSNQILADAKENATRIIAGLGPKTAEDEKAWLDSKSPSDDSRTGSG